MKESCEDFADNHDPVHAKMKYQLSSPQLSSRNPIQVTVREQTPLNNHTSRLGYHWLPQLSIFEPGRLAGNILLLGKTVCNTNK